MTRELQQCTRCNNKRADLYYSEPTLDLICKQCLHDELDKEQRDKIRILESTIASMTTTMAMKDVHIRAQQDEINRLHRIVSSN